MVPLLGQTPEAGTRAGKIAEKAYASLAVVDSEGPPTSDGGIPVNVSAALVVRADGVLLTSYQVLKDARAVRVQFMNGVVFNQVELLGVDVLRNIAAIKIIGQGMPVLSAAPQAKVGDAVGVVSNTVGYPVGVTHEYATANKVRPVFQWLASTALVARIGPQVIQFTSSPPAADYGGVLIDSQGDVLGLIPSTFPSGRNPDFAVPLNVVAGLASAKATRTFENGSTMGAKSFASDRVLAPKSTPKMVAIIEEPAVPGGDRRGTGPVRILEGTALRGRIKMVQSVYPAEAKAARVEGAVKLTTVIGQDGAVQTVTYLSGPTILAKSAQTAVSQWLFKPYLVSGQPVTVITEITLTFSLR